MKRIKFILLVGIVAGLGACNPQVQNEEADLAIPVSVVDIKAQSIQQYINTTGTAKAIYETELASEMAGEYQLRINPATGRPFKLGDQVRAGQVIIHLNDDEYVNNIALEAKKLNLEISKQEYQKQQSLFEKGGVTESELRNSEISMINAEYDYESAQFQLAKMDIVAPFTGIIVDLPYYSPGTRVASGQTLVTLMNYEKMYMDVNLPEKYLPEVTLGQEVFITSYTLSEDTLRGEISELAPVISTETRTFKGKITIDNAGLKLRPGMFVKADIITAHKDSTIVIPKDIIISSNWGKSVYIVERSNARSRRITTGIENPDYVEVVEGLNVNDRLVIRGFETLRNGSKVKIIR
jgi:membrane fusion protein, multidrug efflux system